MNFVQLMNSLREPLECYFVRHGESRANKESVIQGLGESPLSLKGLQQARATAKWFKSRNIRHIFSSPLERAYDTACAIGEQVKVAVETRSELVEIDTGILSGLSLPEAQRKHPEVWERFQLQSWEGVPEAESIVSVKKRAFSIWEALVAHRAHHEGAILSVLHGGILQWVIKTSICDDPARWIPICTASNCGIFAYSSRPVSFGEKTSYYGAWTLMNEKSYE